MKRITTLAAAGVLAFAVSPLTQPADPIKAADAALGAAAIKTLQVTKRLNLDVQTIAPFHGARTTDMAELARYAGKTSRS